MTEQKKHEEENFSKCLQQPALRQAEAKDQEIHPSLTAAGSGSAAEQLKHKRAHRNRMFQPQMQLL